MKKLLTILTALLLAVAAAPAQDYQAPPVQVSHDRVSVDGKLYYFSQSARHTRSLFPTFTMQTGTSTSKSTGSRPGRFCLSP